MNESPKPGMCHKGWIYFILMFVFAAIVYREALVPGNVLFTTDDSLGAMAMRKSMLPHAFFGGWYDITLVGLPMFLAFNFTNALLTVLSPIAFMNWLHLLDLLIGSWFLMMFLRLRGIGWMAAVLGALAAYWFGSTFFLTYAGHIGKFGAVMFAGMYLYLVERAVRDRSWSFAILAGAAMAGMFLEQQDSALFFSMVLGPYAVFRGWQAFQFNVKSHANILIPLVLTAGLISLHSVYSAMTLFGMDGAAGANEQSEQQQWDYCTQWSWPPLETIEFIAPGFMGWQTGEPNGPYWGSLGQSPGWQKQYGPNGKNFKLETFYIGLLPLMFMVLGICISFIKKRDNQAAYQQMLFWSIAGLITFLLACGKYTPLYALFYKLPGISSIRNPVKFMQITQFAIGILAAVGLDFWIRHLQKDSGKTDPDGLSFQSFRKWVFYTAIVLSLFAVIILVKQSGQAESFRVAGWGERASSMAGTMVAASIHLAVMGWLGWGLLTAGASDKSVKFTSWRHLGWAILIIVMVDQLLISHRYVSAIRVESLVNRGDLIPDVERELGHKRLYLWDRLPQELAQWRGLFNNWQTILLPNYGIPTINMISTRIPSDLEKFNSVMDQRLMRKWSHMALGLTLMPSDFWAQARNDRVMRETFQEVAAYTLVQSGTAGYSTMRVSGQQPSQLVLLRNVRPSFRYALVGMWKGADLDGALADMSTGEPFQKVMISPAVPASWPVPTTPGIVGSVTVDAYRDGRSELTVSTDSPAVLRMSEYYSPDWKAVVDGVDKEVVRCDGVFTGVLIEPSDKPQKVVMEYRPPRTTLYVQFAGFGITGAALLFSIFVRRRTDD